ncbi:hypothetical protein PQQ75_08315 [Paraburkholderia aspalathi]|uniref:hypothetical protein n=1 Tax=Paraburkholderia aspalathi TaxID=1324617 RepID=UPI0038BBC201
MPITDAVPLRDDGEPQVLWIKGRSTAEIYNEAELRMSAAKALSLSFLLVEQLADGQQVLNGAVGALHLLMSDAEALYRATYKAMRSPLQVESDA